MNKEELKKAWEKFTENKDFTLNPDPQHVEAIIDGVLELQEKHGLKLCPCRLSDRTRESELKLICPCNFKTQEIWQKEGRCWCGLFIKK